MLKNIREYFRIKRQSLIFKLLFYFILSMLIVALILSINFASRLKPHFKNELLPNVARYIEYVVDDIGVPPNLDRAQTLATDLPFGIRIEGENVDWSSQPQIDSIDNFELEQASQPYQEYFIGRKRDGFVLMVEKQAYRYLLVMDSRFNSISRKRHWALFVALGGTLLILYFFIRRMFRPIATMANQVRGISKGELDNPTDIRGEDDLAQLAQGINDMSLQIKTMLESKAGLLLAISHELRSPMTRMRVNLELLKDSEIKNKLIEDIREMEQLVSNVLESERLNTNHAPLNKSKLDLAETISAVIEEHFSGENIEADLSSVIAEFDEVRIRLLIKNLLDNACRYSVDGSSPAKIELEEQGNFILLRISDRGAGISKEDIMHISEPFYRADSARQRKTGGYGLGLYLCKLIVEAHQGHITFQSTLGEGTTVTVQFPG